MGGGGRSFSDNTLVDVMIAEVDDSSPVMKRLIPSLIEDDAEEYEFDLCGLKTMDSVIIAGGAWSMTMASDDLGR